MNRDQLLDRIRTICYNSDDPIEFEEYASMTVEQLRTVIAILDDGGAEMIRATVGTSATTRSGHCFLLENLVMYLHSNPRARNPVTNRRITKRQREVIVGAYRDIQDRIVARRAQQQQQMRQLIALGVILGVGLTSAHAYHHHEMYTRTLTQIRNEVAPHLDSLMGFLYQQVDAGQYEGEMLLQGIVNDPHVRRWTHEVNRVLNAVGRRPGPR